MIPAHSLFRLETHSSVQLQLFLVLIGKLPKAHSYLPMDAKVLSLQLVASWWKHPKPDLGQLKPWGKLQRALCMLSGSRHWNGENLLGWKVCWSRLERNLHPVDSYSWWQSCCLPARGALTLQEKAPLECKLPCVVPALEDPQVKQRRRTNTSADWLKQGGKVMQRSSHVFSD